MDPPAKKRKIIAKACEACRTRKAKCDGITPSCASCMKRGVECVYTGREQPGLRPGFGKSLEQRLTRMEGSLEQIHHLLQTGSTVVPRRHGDQGYGSGDIYASSYRQPSQDLAVATESTAVANDNSIALSPSAEDIYTGQNEFEVPEGLPPRHMLQHLTTLYFDFAHPWTNILDRSQVEDDITKLDRLVQLHCITLFGFMFWDQVEPNLDIRQNYMENSRQRLLATAIDDISLSSIQALVTLAIDAIGQGPSSRTLNIMSLLNTAVTQLDVAREKQPGAGDTRLQMVNNQVHHAGNGEDSEEDRTLGRRLLWTAYTLDRIIGVSHGIECNIAPNLFRRTRLTDEEMLSPSSRIQALADDVRGRCAQACLPESWLKLVEICTLIERVNEFILSPMDLSDPGQSQEWKNRFRALDAALCAWENLRSLNNSDPVEMTTHAIYQTAIIRMHSVAAFPPRSCSFITASPLAPSRCHQAVKSICDMCESLNSDGFKRLGPIFVFAVWVASRNTITLWTSGWEEQTPIIPPELTTLRNSLRQMARYWPCAEQFSAMIDFVVDAPETERSNQPSMLTVFNDVSHTAYGLHNVLGRRMKQDRDVQMAQLWEWFSIPGMEEMNPFA